MIGRVRWRNLGKWVTVASWGQTLAILAFESRGTQRIWILRSTQQNLGSLDGVINVSHQVTRDSRSRILMITIIVVTMRNILIIIFILLTSAEGSQSHPSGMHWQSLHCSPDRQPSSDHDQYLFMIPNVFLLGYFHKYAIIQTFFCSK